MIRCHQFNTEWYGNPIGIVDRGQLTSVTLNSLQLYSWVEYRGPLDDFETVMELNRLGFIQIGSQVHLRLSLSKIPHSCSLDRLEIHMASQNPFSLKASDISLFHHERFFAISGITVQKIQERYVLWANRLIKEYPQWCMRVMYEGNCQGWFLAFPEGRILNLSLAMLHAQAKISGMLLYQKALFVYHQMGMKIGKTDFSATNVPVLNMYAQLGARFDKMVGCWLWSSDSKP